MLLDQQVAMETAFAGPLKIATAPARSSPQTVAGYDPERFVELFKQTPAVHRYPGSMAGRVQALAQAVVDDWGGDAAAIWTQGDPDGAEVLKRLKALPGFGDQKARIFLALLGKQLGLEATGWREAAGTTARTAATARSPTSSTPSRSPRCARRSRRRRRRRRRRSRARSRRRAAGRTVRSPRAFAGAAVTATPTTQQP